MRFMIQATMDKELTKKHLEELMTVLPAQEASDKKRIKQGIQEASAMVATDRSSAWMVLNGDSEDEIQGILQTFPTYKFSNWRITSLLNEEDNAPS